MSPKVVLLALPVLTGSGCGSQAGLGGDDQDGIMGGGVTFLLTVSDSSFTPTILAAQNLATVTLTLTNKGRTPHGFRLDCMGAVCFPDTAKIEPIAPDATATVVFQTPRAEGIYAMTSNGSGDGVPPGQFIVK